MLVTSQLLQSPSTILYCISYYLPLVMFQAKKINWAIHLVFFNLVEFLFPLMLERWCPCCQLWWRIICISHQKSGETFHEFKKGLIYSNFVKIFSIPVKHKTSHFHSCLDENWDVQRFLCKSQFNIFLTKLFFQFGIKRLGRCISGTWRSLECYIGGY